MTDTTMAATALAAFNRRWLDEVRQHLAPACAPHATFWDRWAAVRYLADGFAEPYKLLGELLDVLLEGLDPPTAGKLVDDRRAIDDLRADFDQIGRERGNAVAAAAIACSLLATLQRCCREMEDAVRALEPERVSSRVHDTLALFTMPAAGTPS